MDDRLNQVQTTDLTDSRVNHEFVDWLKTKGINWLLAILLVACGFLGWDYLKQRKTNARDQAWEELASATSPAAYRGVAEMHAEQDAIAELAMLQAADSLLVSTLTGNVGEGEDAETTPLTPEDRASVLTEADELYARAATLAAGRPGLAGKPVGLSALFGRAAVAEASGRFEDARTHLEAAAALADPEYTSLAEQARARAASLETLSGAGVLPTQASIFRPVEEGDAYTPPVAEDLLELFEFEDGTASDTPGTADEGTPGTP
ncbi:MAG: hypothetical protein VX672_02945 [Planctomycetota bacterium]|nr:hypothetical protein [Planctomycetota bacterium]